MLRFHCIHAILFNSCCAPEECCFPASVEFCQEASWPSPTKGLPKHWEKALVEFLHCVWEVAPKVSTALLRSPPRLEVQAMCAKLCYLWVRKLQGWTVRSVASFWKQTSGENHSKILVLWWFLFSYSTEILIWTTELVNGGEGTQCVAHHASLSYSSWSSWNLPETQATESTLSHLPHLLEWKTVESWLKTSALPQVATEDLFPPRSCCHQSSCLCFSPWTGV